MPELIFIKNIAKLREKINQGGLWRLINPYIRLAREKWKGRDIDDFPCREVEELIASQIEKNRLENVNQEIFN